MSKYFNKTVTDSHYIYQYADVSEFMKAACSKTAANKGNGSDCKTYWTNRDYSNKWVGDLDNRNGARDETEYSFDTIKTKITTGWTHGVELIFNALNSDRIRTVGDADSIKRTRKRGDQGDELDIHAIYRGDLERAWTQVIRTARPSISNFRFTVDSIACGGESVESMIWRGAVAVKLADMLGVAGYGVEVGSGFTTRIDSESNRRHTVRIVTKPFGVNVSLPDLAATTAMPGFFRAIGHNWLSYGVQERHHHHSGVSVINYDPIYDDEIVIGQNIDSQEKAVAFIEKIINKINAAR